MHRDRLSYIERGEGCRFTEEWFFHHYATSRRASFFCIEVVAYLKRFTGRVSGASIWILLSSRFYRNNSVYIPHGAGAHDRSTSLVEDYF